MSWLRLPPRDTREAYDYYRLRHAELYGQGGSRRYTFTEFIDFLAEVERVNGSPYLYNDREYIDGWAAFIDHLAY